MPGHWIFSQNKEEKIFLKPTSLQMHKEFLRAQNLLSSNSELMLGIFELWLNLQQTNLAISNSGGSEISKKAVSLQFQGVGEDIFTLITYVSHIEQTIFALNYFIT